jgi:hypothetical protein
MPTTKAQVRLLDPGQPPRKKLRYAWHPGRTETLAIELRTTAATEAEGEHPPDVPLPSVRFLVSIVPREATADGVLPYDWHVTSTRVMPAPGADPQLAAGMRAEVAVIDHLAGKATVAPTGLSKDVSIDPSSLGDATDAGATGQMVEQIRQTLFDLMTPMPDEEVGSGARWEKISRLASKSSVVTQTETFTLRAIAGDKGMVEDVLAQTAPPQDWPMPGGAREPARLESMLATGTAHARFDLARVVPSSTFEGTTTMVVSGRGAGGGGDRRLTMILRVGITLSGSTP